MIVESYEDVIVLSGSLHSNNWETIHTAIALTLQRHPTGVILDCSGITNCTPEGAETFHDAIQFVQEHDRARIIVAAVPPEVLKVIKDVPTVRSQLPIADSVEDARRSLDILQSSEPEGKKKKESTKVTKRSALVTTTPGNWDTRVFEVARDWAEDRQARLVVLIPLIIPRELPLQAPVPAEEQAATGFMTKAKQILSTNEVKHGFRLERGRDIATLIQHIAEEEKVDAVLVGLSPILSQADENTRAMKGVLEKVRRPILFSRGPIDE